MKPSFISHAIYSETGYNNNHPLGIGRIGPVEVLCKNLGWLNDDSEYNILQSPRADFETLTKFHYPEYVEALIASENQKPVPAEIREKYALGTFENPVFEGLYQRASTCVGGSIYAAEMAAKNGLAYHPAGGTHHGRKDRASGFCYFNDPVFSILTFLKLGFSKCIYLDIDAHHGDGVEAAFHNEDRVFCISTHEENRWPYSGKIDDRSSGNARNLPVPNQINDSEFLYLIDEAVAELIFLEKPDCMVLTCGADCLEGDPLSSMNLSNRAFWTAVKKQLDLNIPTVVLGGGGYNPWTVSRGWAGLWGIVSNQEFPNKLDQASKNLLANMSCDLVDEEDVKEGWLEKIADNPNEGNIREEFYRIRETILK